MVSKELGEAGPSLPEAMLAAVEFSTGFQICTNFTTYYFSKIFIKCEVRAMGR